MTVGMCSTNAWLAAWASTAPPIGWRGFRGAQARARRLPTARRSAISGARRRVPDPGPAAAPQHRRVLDYGFDGDQRPYFTMALLQGRAPSPATPTRPVLSGWRRVGSAARRRIHRRGIIHRDSKPETCWSMPTAGCGAGLRLRWSGSDHRIAGTVGYIAPEICRARVRRVQRPLSADGLRGGAGSSVPAPIPRA